MYINNSDLSKDLKEVILPFSHGFGDDHKEKWVKLFVEWAFNACLQNVIKKNSNFKEISAIIAVDEDGYGLYDSLCCDPQVRARLVGNLSLKDRLRTYLCSVTVFKKCNTAQLTRPNYEEAVNKRLGKPDEWIIIAFCTYYNMVVTVVTYNKIRCLGPDAERFPLHPTIVKQHKEIVECVIVHNSIDKYCGTGKVGETNAVVDKEFRTMGLKYEQLEVTIDYAPNDVYKFAAAHQPEDEEEHHPLEMKQSNV